MSCFISPERANLKRSDSLMLNAYNSKIIIVLILYFDVRILSK